MDNISKEDVEKEVTPKDLGDDKVADIQFEEVLDIDKIQKKLQEDLAKSEMFETDLKSKEEQENLDEEDLGTKVDLPEELSDDSAIEAKLEKQILNIIKPPSKTDSNAKKYVVYVDSENIEFMENLGLNQRRDLINKILKEQSLLNEEQRQLNKKKTYMKHVVLATITFIAFIPFLFVLVNKSLEATIINYQQAKQNFTKLYKQQGKIKLKTN